MSDSTNYDIFTDESLIQKSFFNTPTTNNLFFETFSTKEKITPNCKYLN